MLTQQITSTIEYQDWVKELAEEASILAWEQTCRELVTGPPPATIERILSKTVHQIIRDELEASYEDQTQLAHHILLYTDSGFDLTITDEMSLPDRDAEIRCTAETVAAIDILETALDIIEGYPDPRLRN